MKSEFIKIWRKSNLHDGPHEHLFAQPLPGERVAANVLATFYHILTFLTSKVFPDFRAGSGPLELLSHCQRDLGPHLH